MTYTIRGMKIIIGFGNPDQQYRYTRHNVGFILLDNLAEQWGASFTPSTRFLAHIAESIQDNEKIILVKPTTYYNDVGRSARALLDFYHASPTDVLVIHDDLALPLGTIRTRWGGSSGGNNGLISLEKYIGQGTARLRVGTWTNHHHGIDKATIVLSKLTQRECTTLAQEQAIVEQIIAQFITNSFTVTTYRLPDESL